MKIFDLFWINKIYKKNTHIYSQALFETAQLVRVDKICCCVLILKSFTNDFFNEFSQIVKENDWIEHFWRVISYFIGFGNDDWREHFKYVGQYSMFIHTLAMLKKLKRHLLFFKIAFRYFQEIWSRFEVDKLLHLVMGFWNSSLEKCSHSLIDFKGILSSNLELIWQLWAKLKFWYKAYYRSSSLIQRYPLYCNTSIAGILCFLIQFIRS